MSAARGANASEGAAPEPSAVDGDAGRGLRRNRRSEALAIVGLLLAVLVTTGHRFANEFVWDDIYVIVRGLVIHDASNIPDIFANHTMFASEVDVGRGGAFDTYRPVTLTTFVIDSALSRRDPLAYHMTSMLLHLANVWMVFALARKSTSMTVGAAFFAAAWFGLSPDLAEAHVWINGRSDPLCAFFGLASVLVWIDSRGKPLRRCLVSVLFLLGLLSKEVLLMTVPALLAFPYAGEVVSVRARMARALPFLVAAASYLAIRIAVLSGIHAANGSAHVIAALRVVSVLLLDGASELVAPNRVYVRSLIEDYAGLGVIVLTFAALVVVVAAVLVVRGRRKHPVLSFGLLWFAATLAPASLIAVQMWPGFGRYLYLPAIGFTLGVTTWLAAAVDHVASRGQLSRATFSAAAGVYLALLGVRLAMFTADFRNEERLYTSIIEAAPDRSHGYGWLGMTFVERGRPAEAVPLLFAADQRAPWDGRYLENLGAAYLALGDVPRALDIAATGIRRYEANGRFHELAARSLAASDPERAAAHLRTCLEAAPNHPACTARRDSLRSDPDLGARYRALLP